MTIQHINDQPIPRPHYALCAMLAALFASAWPAALSAGPGDAWHRDSATHRFRVEVTTPRLASSLDVASLVVDTLGLGDPQGRDLAMFDAEGRRVLMNVDTSLPGQGRLFRIEFHVRNDAAGPYTLYVGGGPVDAAPLRPNYGGLQLAAGPLPPGNLHESYERLKQLLPRFTPMRTGPRPNIDDLENPLPFRDQDGLSGDNTQRGRHRYVSENNRNFMGIYRGTLYVPETGRWTIATNCDDASFVEINGNFVVGRPGRGRKDGDPNRPMLNAWDTRANVQLERGIHELTYYHIQVDNNILARLGWRAPGAREFRVVPAKAFVRTLGARVERFENRDGKAMLYFENVIEPTWMFGGDAPVYRERLEARPAGAFENLVWRFENGSDSRGPSAMKFVAHTRTDRNWDIRPVTLEADGHPPVRRLIYIEPSDPDDVELRYIELDIVAPRYVAFRGEPIDLDIRLRNVTGPIDLTLTARMEQPDAPPETLLAMPLPMDESRLEIFRVTVPAADIRDLEWADVVVDVETGGVRIAQRRLLLRTAHRPPADLRVRDGIPQSGGDPVVFVEVGLPPQKALDLRAVRRVAIVGDLLGADEAIEAEAREALRPSLNGDVAVTALPGTSRTVMEAVPSVLTAEIGEGNLAIVSYGLADMQMGTPHDDYERWLSFVVDSLMKRGARVILVTPPPRGTDHHETYRYAVGVKRVGLKRDVPVVDFFSYLRLNPGVESLFDDPVAQRFYPTAAGRRMLMEYLSRQLSGMTAR